MTAENRTPRRSFRFARRPAWVIGHVLVLVAVVVMVNLGLWQLRRLDERRAANERVAARTTSPPVDLTDLAGGDVEHVEFRRVEATGEFDPAGEVLVGYRTAHGLPGYHVVTPLRLADATDGEAVLVNRGFVPLTLAEQWPVDEAAPPDGEVTVVGILRRSLDARQDAIEVAEGEVPKLDDVDVTVIDDYVDADVVPMYIELQRPRPSGYPEPLPDLDLGEGPHFSYAVQWFSFSAIAAIGWIVVLRRRATTVNARTGHFAPGPSTATG